MRRFLTPGVLMGALACGGSVASAAGYPILGAFLSDPSTAQAATQVLAGVTGLVAGYLSGVRGKAA